MQGYFKAGWDMNMLDWEFNQNWYNVHFRLEAWLDGLHEILDSPAHLIVIVPEYIYCPIIKHL